MRNNKRHTIEFYKQIALERGFKCLSDSVINSYSILEWECSKGHRYKTSYQSFRYNGCPACYGNKKLTIEDLHKTAEIKQGKCLSAVYINNRTKYEWQCKNQHTWMATASDIRNDYWCPHCPIIRSQQEIELFETIKQIYPDVIHNIKGLFSSSSMELDIYIPSLKKAIEYDGEYWHSRPEAIKRDNIKNKECVDKDINLYRVKHKEYKKNSEQITTKILDWLKE